MTSDEAKAMLDKMVEGLGEHFDSVSILVTWQDGSGKEPITKSLRRGAGNWYTTIGFMRELLIEDAERVRNYVRRSEEDEP